MLTCKHAFYLPGTSQITDSPPVKQIENILHLAELCIELLQENTEFYADEFKAVRSLRFFVFFVQLVILGSPVVFRLFPGSKNYSLNIQRPFGRYLLWTLKW